MATTSTGPRYAPEDPTLPKPWRGLVDGNTGYLYFWNPETNVTQYERPVAISPPPPPPGPPPPSTPKLASVSTPKLASVSVSSSVHLQHSENPAHGKHGGSHGQQVEDPSSNYGQRHGSGHSTGMRSSEGHHHHYDGNGDVGRGMQPKLAPIPSARQQQSVRNDSGQLQNGPVPHLNGSHGQSYSSNQSFRSSGRTHGSDSGNAAPADAYRRQHEITILGDNIPPPLTTFESTGFPSEILREVHSAGFTSPTPIQAQTWPIALQNRDIVAIAKTGSGKTLGYLIPGFIHLKQRHNNLRMGPTVLVLSPTRELATQIQDEAVKFGRSSRISCACLYGGAPKGPQLRDLDRGVDIVVATPGRLNDILEMKRVSLRQVSYLVLDEADRMLDMGFEPQIRKIVNEIPPRRQTLMYTATWPKEVRKIAADLLVHPVQVNIGNIDELVANKSITQYVEVVPPMEKQRRLEQILRSQEPGSKIIIFCSTKRMCDQLARSISRHFNAAAIHGDKSQGERDWVLNQFRSGKSPILVATDVAARGLDIKDIRCRIKCFNNFAFFVYLKK
ncbi:unnamed protein product [Victoria cruziana]